MCGIVGYLGNREATSFLVDGLSKLEYRGYDSAGVAVVDKKGEVKVVKHKGRLANLEEDLRKSPLQGTVGIGHTRWATHGEPSDVNAHPHKSSKGNVTLVHNGIIENYLELRKFLKEQGYEFKSQTDTEVAVNLVHYYFKGDIFKAVLRAIQDLKGSYALAVVSGEDPDKVVAVRKDSPLIVGLGKDETFIASDIPAVLNYTRDVYLLEDNEVVLATKSGVEVFDKSGNKIEKKVYHVTWSADAAEKGGYDSFMMKEMHEQPKAIKDTLTGKIVDGRVKFDSFHITKEDLEGIDRVFIVACGTAYHAGLMGKIAIEKFAKIPVEVDIASEFRYRDPLVTNRSLVITVSQSGETADTLAVLRAAKKEGAKTVAITNVVGSTISREADNVIYTMAGPEIAVASTKAYTTQLTIMSLLGVYFGQLIGNIDSDKAKQLLEALEIVPKAIEKVLDEKEKIAELAKIIAKEEDVFFLGRGADYALALEGSLKLKEISYIHSEAYAGGELKHGPIALIEEGTKVIALLTQTGLKEKMVSNIVEVKARGAYTIGVAYEDDEVDETVFDKVLRIPRIFNMAAPIVAAVSLQLLAYYTSNEKGLDIDKPRNLAKSVTVE